MQRIPSYTVLLLIISVTNSWSQTSSYHYGFEEPLSRPPWVAEGGINQAQIIKDPTDEGNHVLRAKLPMPQEGSVWDNANTRSEIRWQDGADGIPNWFPNGSSYSYQFRIYIPEDHVCDTNSPEIIAQWHQPNGFDLKSPPISLRSQNCNINLLNQTSAVFRGKQNTLKKSLLRSHRKWEKGSWHYFIVDIHFDYEEAGDGSIKVYLSNSGWPTIEDLVIDFKGGVGYNNGVGQNFKLGVYKWPWKTVESVNQGRSQSPPVTERVYYYDDITIKEGLEFD